MVDSESCEESGCADANRSRDEHVPRYLHPPIMAEISKTRKRKPPVTAEHPGAEVLRAIETEQMRIACELHDGVGQTLSGVVSLAEALEASLHGRQRQAARRLRVLVREAAIEVRRLSHGLSPMVLRNAGLADALRSLANSVSASHRAACSLRAGAMMTSGDEERDTHLYRIAQEAVCNALKHGRPKHIMITLGRRGGVLRMGVVDDGTGFKEAGAGDGIGLQTMRYRAQKIGGSMVIRARATRGTEVVCHVPVLHSDRMSSRAKAGSKQPPVRRQAASRDKA